MYCSQKDYSASERNKKIFYRFLKEVGLYSAWKEYLLEENKKGDYKYVPDYSKFIDSAICNSRFTDYLRKKYGLIFNQPITRLFRYFIYKNMLNCNLGNVRLKRNLEKYQMRAIEEGVFSEGKFSGFEFEKE